MIRLGIVGCGGIATGHVSQLKDALPKGNVTALVDIDYSKAKAASDYFEGSKAYTDYHEIMDKVDAVLLSLPHHIHHDVGMDFLNADKHVLMEKPLANTEKDCLELIETAEDRNLVLMTAYCMRYHPLVIKLKEILDSREYGDVFTMSIWTEQYTYQSPDSWGASAARLGGGQLFSHGCHYTDLLLYFMGKPTQGIHIGTNYCTDWMEKEGTSHAVMKFASGAVAYHFGTWGARGTRLGYTIHAHCSGGMLELDFAKGTLSVLKGIPEGHQEEIVLMDEGGQVKYLARETLHFLDCIEHNRKPVTSARESLESLRVIWKMYDAENNGKIADLSDIIA